MSPGNETQAKSPKRRTLVLAACVGAALVVSAVGLIQRPGAFWPAFLVAVVFWLGTSLGCLGVTLLHALTGGRWGEAVSRELRAGIAAGSIGLAAAVVIALQAGAVYPGARSSSTEALNAHQQQYLALPMVLGRGLLAAIVWVSLGVWLLRGHCLRESRPDAAPAARKAALGLIAFWLTATFASVDGIMSLSPGWASSLFPALQIVGFAVAGLAFSIVVRALAFLPKSPTETERQAMHDLGNMLQAFNLVWVYLAFSQYLIIWSGDLPHEASWYLERRTPLAASVSVGLFALHFVVPFLLLLSRELKRDPARLASVAGLLLLMRLIDSAWTILPQTDTETAWTGLLVVSTWVALGGLWWLVFEAARNRLPAFEISPADTSAVPLSNESSGGTG